MEQPLGKTEGMAWKQISSAQPEELTGLGTGINVQWKYFAIKGTGIIMQWKYFAINVNVQWKYFAINGWSGMP